MSLTFKLSDKVDNAICVDEGKRIAFDHSYSIFSVTM